MGVFSKKKATAGTRSSGILNLAKVSSPILRALYYVAIVIVLLLGIIALIMMFVNTRAENMMLPPFMSVHGDEYYSINIGNGICINAPYDTVSLGDIKTVIFAQLMMLAAVLCIFAPIALFLSKFFKNFSSGKEYELVNVRYIKYIALTVMVGSTFVRLFRGVYNYLLIKTFVSDSDVIRFAFELDFGGIAIGALILVFASVFGNLCERHQKAVSAVTQA